MYSVTNKARKLSLPIDKQLSLFDSMKSPFLMYSSEVWGIGNVEIIDCFYLKFCGSVLNFKQTTPKLYDLRGALYFTNFYTHQKWDLELLV